MRSENIQYGPGRCMPSVHQTYPRYKKEVYPAEQQENMLQAQGETA